MAEKSGQLDAALVPVGLQAARRKKKKEENLRMLKLVDNAYASDPRLRRFREEDRKVHV